MTRAKTSRAGVAKDRLAAWAIDLESRMVLAEGYARRPRVAVERHRPVVKEGVRAAPAAAPNSYPTKPLKLDRATLAAQARAGGQVAMVQHQSKLAPVYLWLDR